MEALHRYTASLRQRAYGGAVGQVVHANPAAGQLTRGLGPHPDRADRRVKIIRNAHKRAVLGLRVRDHIVKHHVGIHPAGPGQLYVEITARAASAVAARYLLHQHLRAVRGRREVLPVALGLRPIRHAAGGRDRVLGHLHDPVIVACVVDRQAKVTRRPLEAVVGRSLQVVNRDIRGIGDPRAILIGCSFDRGRCRGAACRERRRQFKPHRAADPLTHVIPARFGTVIRTKQPGLFVLQHPRPKEIVCVLRLTGVADNAGRVVILLNLERDRGGAAGIQYRGCRGLDERRPHLVAKTGHRAGIARKLACLVCFKHAQQTRCAFFREMTEVLRHAASLLAAETTA